MRKKVLLSVLSTIWLASSFNSAYAHPGKTDANGGHTCHTNCAKWGLQDGEYHYHDSNGNVIHVGQSPAEPTPNVEQSVDIQPANIKVLFNNQPMSFDQPPVIINSRTLVPLRAIFEALGAEVKWDAKTNTVTAVKGDTSIKLTTGNQTAYKNGESIPIDTPPTIVNSRTMIPARFVAEALGASVGWNGDDRVVTIDNESVGADQSPRPTPISITTGKDLKVYFLDVGQGDSTYIKTPDGTDILIDGGNNDKGQVVVQDLKNLGVDDIEYIIATHPDADHIGGLDGVLKAFKVNAVYAPKVSHNTKTFEDFLNAVKEEGISINTAQSGVKLPIGDVDATFVAPEKDYGEDMNDWSAVLHLVYGNNSFLFTGDAENKSESDMIASNESLKSDVLKVGHHGSNTSTSHAFLNTVQPRYAVISVGVDNKYGHPTQETLDKLINANAVIYRTDQQGTITAISDGNSITFTTER